MYKTNYETQMRKDAKKKLILDSAATVFAKKGYHNTTVRDIVNEAAVSVGSFYFYFKSKEELFAELYKSIVDEFNEVTISVIDVENFSMLKNYARVITATLWAYERKRELARIILLEAANSAPCFQALEANRNMEFVRVMLGWFTRFNQHDEVYIPDVRVASLAYVGSYYCLINDWLINDSDAPLTESCYAFCVYSIQALNIPFSEQKLKDYINEVLCELKPTLQ